jgi:hypothetical protein
VRVARPSIKKTQKSQASGAASTTMLRAPRARRGLEAPSSTRTRDVLHPQLAVTPSASLPLGDALPSWVPPDFALERAAKGLRTLMESQGAAVVPVKTLLITDADQTLVETRAKTLVRDAASGELLRHPTTNEPLRLGPEYDAELATLSKQFPQLPWSRVALDFSEFSDAADVNNAKLITTTAKAIRRSDKDADARQLLITARQAPEVLSALRELSRRDDLGLDAVFSANAPAELAALGLEKAALGTPERKALMIAALVELHGATHVTFYDDGDENLARAKELLTAMFPRLTVEIIDIVKNDRGHFEQLAR